VGRPEKQLGQNVPINSAAALADKFGVDERTIKRDGQFAVAVDTLKPTVPDIETRVMEGKIFGGLTAWDVFLASASGPVAIIAVILVAEAVLAALR
jgi:hypothetical protein